MVKDHINIQDQFLNRMRKERITVIIELVTGERIEGLITSFDNFSLIIKNDGERLVYKHAVSSVLPREKRE
ncbi:MAG: RNA chaperone Hfq [Syntrophobacterales bacterium]|nr:MAG: RNA chaperone Hfq [Syntrophobacterales bacterium]